MSALTLWSQGEGRRGECGTGRLPGQSFFHFSHFHCPHPPSPLPAPAAFHAASRQTVFILRRFALFDAADKSNSCSSPLPPPPPLGPFCSFGAASFSIDFRGFAAVAKANSTCLSLVCGFFSSIFGQCCTYDLCSLLLLAAVVAVVAPVVVVASTLLCAQRSIEKFKCSAV